MIFQVADNIHFSHLQKKPCVKYAILSLLVFLLGGFELCVCTLTEFSCPQFERPQVVHLSFLVPCVSFSKDLLIL